MNNPFSSGPRPFAAPAARPAGLGAQVNGWVDKAAGGLPAFQPNLAAPLPGAPIKDNRVKPDGIMTTMPVTDPNDLSVTPHPTLGTPFEGQTVSTSIPVQDDGRTRGVHGQREEEHNPGGGGHDRSGLFDRFGAGLGGAGGGWRGALTQFNGLDGPGKSAMIQQFMANRPDLAANPRLQQFLSRFLPQQAPDLTATTPIPPVV